MINMYTLHPKVNSEIRKRVLGDLGHFLPWAFFAPEPEILGRPMPILGVTAGRASCRIACLSDSCSDLSRCGLRCANWGL